MSWIIFTFITLAVWGITEIFYKKGNMPNEKYSHIKTTFFVGIVMGIHAIYTLIAKDINFDPMNLLIYIPVSLCYIISMTCSYFGVRFIEESISDPIENTSGAIVPVLCALILHESIQMWSIIAICIIVVGVLGVGFLENEGKTDRKKILGKKLAIWAFAMPFCYALLDATGTFLDVYYLDIDRTVLLNVTEDTIEDVANTCYELTFLFMALGIAIFLAVKKVGVLSVADNFYEDDTTFFEGIKLQKFKIIAAIGETVGQFTYVRALSGNGAIASPIIGAGCVVTSVLLSRIFLKEKLTWLQYIFIFLIIAGIAILSIVEGD